MNKWMRNSHITFFSLDTRFGKKRLISQRETVSERAECHYRNTVYIRWEVFFVHSGLISSVIYFDINVINFFFLFSSSGLTALRSDEVIDLMIKEYPAKHAEYSVILQEKERQRIAKEYSVSTLSAVSTIILVYILAFIWCFFNIHTFLCLLIESKVKK